MRIHHLDCCTMCPLGGRWLNGSDPPWRPGRLVGHCLLIEAPDRLVLVDSGVSTLDVREPGRLGGLFVHVVRPWLRDSETALHQVAALGYDPRDVRDIVLTHLDVDHAGGIADFPWARVHVLATEQHAALHPTWRERERYRQAHWAHGPDWALHEVSGEPWMGFPAVRELGVGADVLLVPMIGHTRGHCGVAVHDGERWLLHAGDAAFHHGELDPTHPRSTPLLRLFQNLVAVDREAMHANQARLRELVAGHPEIEVFTAHDPDQLARFAPSG